MENNYPQYHILQSFCFCNNGVWLISRYDSFLYRYDSDERVIEEIVDLGKEGNIELAKIYSYTEKLIVVPRDENYIIYYDTNDGKVSYYDLNFEKREGRYNFATSYIYGKDLYLLGYEYGGIIVLDLETGESCRISDSVGILDGVKLEGCKQNKDKLYTVSQGGGYIVEIDCPERKCKTYALDSFGSGFTDLAFDGDDIYLLPFCTDTPIVKWNSVSHKEMERFDLPYDKSKEEYPFCRMFCIKGNLIIFSYSAPKNLRLNLSKMEWSMFEDLFMIRGIETWKYKCLQQIGEKIAYMRDGVWGVWDPVTNYNDIHFFSISESIANRLRRERFLKDCGHTIISEDSLCNISDFFDYLTFINY